MGNWYSKFNNRAIDGLGFPAIGDPRPTERSFQKLQQLLRSMVSYEPEKLAPVFVSLYFLGLTPELLTTAFDALAEPLKEWQNEDPIADSIGDESLGDYFGLYEYQRRYFEFFRDQLTEYTDWYDILHVYIPLLGTKLLGSNCAPLNQLAVAFEVDDPVLGMHALAYAASADHPFQEAGSLEVTPEELVKMSVGTEYLVPAQSFCELILKNKCFSNDLIPIMSHFAKIVEGAPKSAVQSRKFDVALDELLQNLKSAPQLRAEVFAQGFVHEKLFI